MPQTACPTFFYPLLEPMPRFIPGRFLAQGSISQLPLFAYLGATDVVSKDVQTVLGRVYDPTTGALRTDSHWKDIALHFALYQTYGFVEHLNEYIDWFSPEDLSRSILKHFLRQRRSPFRSIDPWSAGEVSSAFTILHFLGTLQILEGFGDIDLIADDFLDLLEPDTRSSEEQDADVQLDSLVGLKLLDTEFGTNHFGRIDAVTLRSRLTGRIKDLVGYKGVVLTQWLAELRNLIACLHLVDPTFKTFDDLELGSIAATVMRRLGLEERWSWFTDGNSTADLDDVSAAWSKVHWSDGVSSELRSLASRFPGSLEYTDLGFGLRDYRGLGFALFCSYTILALLRRSAAIALIEFAREEAGQERVYGDIPFLLTAPLFVRLVPMVGLKRPQHFWFKGDSSFPVTVVNASADRVSNLHLRIGAQYAKRDGTVGATTLDDDIIHEVELRFWPSADGKGALQPGSERCFATRIEIKTTKPRYPRLLLRPEITCRYVGQRFELNRAVFQVPMVLRILPSRGALRALIERVRQTAVFDETSLLRQIQESLKEHFDIAIDPDEARLLYLELFPSPVARWLQQFDAIDRPLMAKLQRASKIYTTQEVRRLLEKVLRGRRFKADADKALFIGVGRHQGKSGPHMLMYVKHAYKRVFPKKGKEEVEVRFEHPAELLRALDRSGFVRKHPVECVVFVDDFFGSGQTLCSFLKHFRDSRRKLYRDLWKRNKVILAISGFEMGKERILDSFPEFRERIIVADRLLSAKDRAFSPGNTIFATAAERRRAEKICRSVGEEILRARQMQERFTETERKRRALGWDNDQALVFFEHNSPNNSLPIFWEHLGSYRGRRWFPLRERWD